MITKLDSANPFGPPPKTYKTADSAEQRAKTLLERMCDYPGTVATIIVTPVGERFAAHVIFQGKEAHQAAIHAVHFTGLRCFA